MKTCLALLALATLLGVGWPFGLLMTVSEDSNFWHYFFRFLFILCTATQGIFIFYSFCANSKEGKLAWGYLVKKFGLEKYLEFLSDQFKKTFAGLTDWKTQADTKSTTAGDNQKSKIQPIISTTDNSQKQTESSNLMLTQTSNLSSSTINKISKKGGILADTPDQSLSSITKGRRDKKNF